MSQSVSPFLPAAIDAARQAGALIKANYGTDLGVNETLQYDLKLELDVLACARVNEAQLVRV